ncbi:Flagellar L-ring protein FlgH [hydrothermal vent metagenome]|uniref:Flagellar L-ring protein FlgH n=1 Tax=hydrothermal vent metagenome TaxID=652676 RepID=A0A3B0T365_9ZZZZ
MTYDRSFQTLNRAWGKSPGRLMIVAVALATTGCAYGDRLAEIGQQPTLSAIENPNSQPGYKPVRMPMPTPAYASTQPNSLWRSGSRAFFKDQRASRVGDILTVNVSITDRAKLDNKTSRSRSSSENMNVTSLFGLETTVFALKDDVAGSAKVGLGGDGSASGQGKVDRKETLSTTLAAVVTQVLPNGNLVVEGRQEVRVNFEVRELIIAGIVRPEDIKSDNTIDSAKIAEARIAYGGRGQITDVQQPRFGQQIIDILLPF